MRFAFRVHTDMLNVFVESACDLKTLLRLKPKKLMESFRNDVMSNSVSPWIGKEPDTKLAGVSVDYRVLF